MDDYKKVIEILGEENLVPFLELNEKFFQKWKIKPQEFLKILKNISKDELIGLVADTHEIKPKPMKFRLYGNLGGAEIDGEEFSIDLFKQIGSVSKEEAIKFFKIYTKDVVFLGKMGISIIQKRNLYTGYRYYSFSQSGEPYYLYCNTNYEINKGKKWIDDVENVLVVFTKK